MQKSMNEVMGRYFVALNVPTRNDVLSLGNRLTEIETRLLSIEDAVRAIKTIETNGGTPVAEPAAVATPRPARTRKPPED
jgi:hypothetical protein